MRGSETTHMWKIQRQKCIRLPLALCVTYSNIFVLMLFSWIILPCPSPTVSRSLFFKSVSPLLPCTQNHRFYLSRFRIHLLTLWCLSFSFWLASLCMMGSRCITQGTRNWCSVTTWKGGVGREGEGGVQEVGDKCMPMADLHWYAAEAFAIL